MKSKYVFPIFLLTLAIALTSCASKEKVIRERDETYIADLDSFYIGELHLYTRVTINQPKISDFEVTFSPRSNIIYFKAKLGLDIISIGVSYKERQKLYEIALEYIDAYKNNTLKNEKPSKKNAYFRSKTYVSWGVFGYTHSVLANYITNVEYLETDKPYFRLKFEATDDPEDGSTTPAFSIYISPSQWQTIFEMCNQESLEAQVDEILAQAEAF